MARNFTATGDTATNTSFPAVPTNGSVAVWVAPGFNSGDSTARMIVDWTEGTNTWYILRFSDNNVYYGNNTVVVADTGFFTSGTWVHLSFSWVGTTVTAYKNGVQVGSPTVGGPGGTATKIEFGNDTLRSQNSRQVGKEADGATWNTNLTAAEMLALANGARPKDIRPLSLVGYWPMDGLASPEPDLSGNARNLTLTGTALAFGPQLMQFTPRSPHVIVGAAAAAGGPGFIAARALAANLIYEGFARH